MLRGLKLQFSVSSSPGSLQDGRVADSGPWKSFQPRLLLATDTWSGLGGNGNWSSAGNWSGGAPTPGEILVFPAGATQLTSVDYMSGLESRGDSVRGGRLFHLGHPTTHFDRVLGCWDRQHNGNKHDRRSIDAART